MFIYIYGKYISNIPSPLVLVPSEAAHEATDTVFPRASAGLDQATLPLEATDLGCSAPTGDVSGQRPV